MKFLFVFFLLGCAVAVCAQSVSRPVKSKKKATVAAPLSCPSYYDTGLKTHVYTRVEIEPEYPGGSAAWQRFLNKTLRYPQDQIDSGNLQSTCVLSFVVGPDGKVSNISIINRGDSPHYSSFDRECISVIERSGLWTPGKCNGKTVAVLKKQPIIIHLEIEE